MAVFRDRGFGIDDAYPSGSSTRADPRHDERILKVMTDAQKLVP